MRIPETGQSGKIDDIRERIETLTRGVAEHGREEYARLQQEIRASPVVYGDEAGWREAGRNGYLWSFSNPKVRYFLRRGSRGGKVVEEVLGDEFEGALISDFYGAYNVHQGLRQRLERTCRSCLPSSLIPG